jgi:7-cyano-7-deazaguanine synthase
MKTILIYSGGMDSTTLLYELLAAGDDVRCLGVNYGQRHGRELNRASEIAGKLGIECRVADLRTIKDLIAGSSLTSDDIPVPEGHFKDEIMKATVVPNRNMIMLAVALGWCVSLKYDRVAYAAHGGDHAIYPDCRPEFVEALDRTAALADWHRASIYAPYLGITKADIAKRGSELAVPYVSTWSCYKGGIVHCGKCGTCTERREAFQLAGVPDPTRYQG